MSRKHTHTPAHLVRSQSLISYFRFEAPQMLGRHFRIISPQRRWKSCGHVSVVSDTAAVEEFGGRVAVATAAA